ncbi:hypothetical protein ACFL1X_08960, partial [Candidatus Hydrogenedentota bacterium]
MRTVQIFLCCAALFCLTGIGAAPRKIEELQVGGGYGDSADGGVDIESDGDLKTDGDVTVGTVNGVDPSALPQGNVVDSDEGQDFPGTDHTVDQAGDLEEELDALRHMVKDVSGNTNWYDAVPTSLDGKLDLSGG